MRKLIIGFYGAENNGKTSALNRLIDRFPKESIIRDFSEENSKDRIVCINYKGVKLGIATEGDDGKTISRNIKCFIDEECDLIVTACRTSGKTHDAINEYKNECDIHYITCPYLYLLENAPLPIQLEQLDISSAALMKTYIDEIIENK